MIFDEEADSRVCGAACIFFIDFLAGVSLAIVHTIILPANVMENDSVGELRQLRSVQPDLPGLDDRKGKEEDPCGVELVVTCSPLSGGVYINAEFVLLLFDTHLNDGMA